MTQSTLSIAQVNGHAETPAKKGGKRRKGSGTAEAKSQTHLRVMPATVERRFKITMTIALGVGIPLLSLAMSSIAGTLATHGLWPLAVFAFALMAAVLGVSLPHLAWAIGDITRSGSRPSWLLAVALDLSLVLCEFCHVWADDLGLTAILWAVTVAVAGASMLLNIWAFFKAPQGN
jgi:hypothetical protein